MVNDLQTLPLAERLKLVQSLWDSIAAEQGVPELSDADRQLSEVPAVLLEELRPPKA